MADFRRYKELSNRSKSKYKWIQIKKIKTGQAMYMFRKDISMSFLNMTGPDHVSSECGYSLKKNINFFLYSQVIPKNRKMLETSDTCM